LASIRTNLCQTIGLKLGAHFELESGRHYQWNTRPIDKHSKKLIISNLEMLLNYCEHFYDRQFTTRKEGLEIRR
jgi:hypothetical protein